MGAEIAAATSRPENKRLRIIRTATNAVIDWQQERIATSGQERLARDSAQAEFV